MPGSPRPAGLSSFQQGSTQTPEKLKLSSNADNPLPLQGSQPGKRSKGRPPFNPRLAVPLVLVVLLVIAGSFLGQHFLQASTTLLPNKAANGNANGGNFVAPPLSSQQIDNLRHLTDHMKYQQLAYLYVSRMSLDEEIGQIMMVEYSENAYSPSLDTMIHDLHAGGVIMYQRQINTLAQTKADTAHMQQRATSPLLISADEEGWNVHRLTNIYPPRLSAHDIRNSNSTTVAANEGQKVAHDLLSVGINTNLAPDVDVSPDDGYIGWDQRAFGSTPEDVIKYAGPYTKAMQTGGVIASMKHFPGLGGAPKTTDPHAVFVTVNHTKDQIYKIDLAPFQYFIHSSDKMEQPGMIMSTDVLLPAIDPTYIAELSPTFITKILRNEMGYNGVVITDALTMLGVQVNGQHLDLATAGVMALKAGNDLLLGAGDPASMRSMIDGIKTALNNGTLSKTRLDEAAARVITLKMERHLIAAVPPPANA
ncbi:glycoside hydrolase family 3 [Dictyobacter formicarum]|uniref:Glycoside hydrolase family 3 n=1 Tax=Dictyobacter formicarum TaxID=2778368 RepID=A0ABQ3VUD4_9CHLR|nr:glycoside hydrolase family 3 [Dictyobacter formicarum]